MLVLVVARERERCSLRARTRVVGADFASQAARDVAAAAASAAVASLASLAGTRVCPAFRILSLAIHTREIQLLSLFFHSPSSLASRSFD